MLSQNWFSCDYHLLHWILHCYQHQAANERTMACPQGCSNCPSLGMLSSPSRVHRHSSQSSRLNQLLPPTIWASSNSSRIDAGIGSNHKLLYDKPRSHGTRRSFRSLLQSVDTADYVFAMCTLHKRCFPRYLWYLLAMSISYPLPAIGKTNLACLDLHDF